MKKVLCILLAMLLLGLTACSGMVEPSDQTQPPQSNTTQEETGMDTAGIPNDIEIPSVNPGETTTQISKYVDENGDIAIVPKDFYGVREGR